MTPLCAADAIAKEYAKSVDTIAVVPYDGFMSYTVKAMQTEIMTLMSVPTKWDGAKRWAVAQSRLCGLGLYQTCGRCYGSGQHSYCQQHGTTCFGCNGSGRTAPRVTAKLVEEARAKVETGEFTKYMEDLRRRNELKRSADAALSGVMQAWVQTGVEKLYDWHKSYGDDACEYDKEVSQIVNRPMHDAYTMVSDMANKCDAHAYTREKMAIAQSDATNKAALIAELDVEFERRRAALLAQAELAKVAIAEAYAKYPAIKAKYGRD